VKKNLRVFTVHCPPSTVHPVFTAMDKRKILIQLDTDPHPSVFDRVVAIDAGADELFSYGGVRPEQVRDLVHGAIFTRHPRDLKHTALFIGGSEVAAGERLLEEVRKHLLPQYGLRVSVLLDSNGCNTTASAAVQAAARHVDLAAGPALVLGGTGPVGQRVALLLARAGAPVRLGSRQREKAVQAAERIRARVPAARVEPAAGTDPDSLKTALDGCQLVIAAGAAGATLLPEAPRRACPTLKVLVDLNAVPPAGIEGVQPTDKGTARDNVLCYGALGVGDAKMKIHKAAIGKLFETNDAVLDIEEIFEIANEAKK
jgi:hypothetical protein